MLTCMYNENYDVILFYNLPGDRLYCMYNEKRTMTSFCGIIYEVTGYTV